MSAPRFRDPAVRRRSKYRNVRTVIDGFKFSSKKESSRYVELKYLQSKGLVSHLRLQPKFPLVVNGVRVANYFGDFAYVDCDGNPILEDVKSGPTRTAAYVLKKKLVKAIYGIEILET